MLDINIPVVYCIEEIMWFGYDLFGLGFAVSVLVTPSAVNYQYKSLIYRALTIIRLSVCLDIWQTFFVEKNQLWIDSVCIPMRQI